MYGLYQRNPCGVDAVKLAVRSHGRNERDPAGDPEGVVFDVNQLQESDSTKLLCGDIAAYLERYYPGWLWAVGPDVHQGMINISSFRLSNEWAYRINLRTTPLDDPKVRQRVIVMAAGEILERFGQVRGPCDVAAYLSSPRAFSGEPMMDIKDKDKRLQRHYRDHDFDKAVKNGRIELGVNDDPQSGRRDIWIRPGANNDDDR